MNDVVVRRQLLHGEDCVSRMLKLHRTSASRFGRKFFIEGWGMTRVSACRLAGKRVFVAGHRGMMGSAIVRRLISDNCKMLVADRGEELAITDVATSAAKVVRYQGRLAFDPSKPECTPRTLLDHSRSGSLACTAVSLEAGLCSADEDFLQGHDLHLQVDAAG